MNLLQWTNTLVILIGIPAIVGALVYFGKNLHLLESLNSAMGIVKHNLMVVSNYLIRYQSDFSPSELKPFSPSQLTDAGKALIRTTGFDRAFEENKTAFFNFIDDENPKLKYDVELAAIKSIAALHNMPFMDSVRIYLYHHPERDLQNTAPTLGVYIREKYLEEHPEIRQ